MNRYEMEPILNPSGRFVIYGDHLNAVEKLQAQVEELEAALTHWKGNAYRASDKCDRYREALEQIDSATMSQFANEEGMLRFVCTTAYNALNP